MLWKDLQRIRTEAPLIHNITNYVVMNTTANALIAIGASPVMAHAIEEVEDMVKRSRALVINIGTLSIDWINAMVRAGHMATHSGIPIIFDPVGSGSTRFRTETSNLLLRNAPPVIVRGNPSEIRSMVVSEQVTKGVDSVHRAEEILDSAQFLSGHSRCVVSISGPTDYILEDKSVIRIFNGHPMMNRVTGLGCVATALTGAFAAVNHTFIQAAANAMALMGIAGEMAAERSAGPGSFMVNFLDTLYTIEESDINSRLKMEVTSYSEVTKKQSKHAFPDGRKATKQ